MYRMPNSKATQDFVPVHEIRNGVVILKDGGYRGILMCSSINFSLKSEQEQQAIIGGFQSFLNTLDFTVQIVVHSRRMDIRPYLGLLQERMDKQETELMRLQLREYISFIHNFIEGADIMTKMFYVVVPYSSSTTSEVAKSIGNGFGFGKKKADKSDGETVDTDFEEYRVQLEQRMALVAAGLASSGLRAIPLGTEEIIELMYRSFNLGEMENPIHLTNM
jgi:type IV secretory pathway VirB4 component